MLSGNRTGIVLYQGREKYRGYMLKHLNLYDFFQSIKIIFVLFQKYICDCANAECSFESGNVLIS